MIHMTLESCNVTVTYDIILTSDSKNKRQSKSKSIRERKIENKK